MNVYAFITPLVLILLLTEMAICLKRGNGYYNFQDTIANLTTGIGNQCVNLAVALFVFNFYGWIYQFAPWKIAVTWYNLFILLILQDFVFYWFHRAGHTINIFWAAHSPHHSSEEMNLSVGIRASFTQRLFQFLFFDWILVLLGFFPEMVYSMAAVHLFLAYWHHTRLIGRLGWFEKWFVTPSHHRVHHGVNTQYLDKNFSEFLIVWDKWFETFEEEKEPICYGILHPPRTRDPIAINLQYWNQLWSDAVATPRWWDKIRLWFMPLGWRPPGVGEHFQRIGYTLEEQVKYQSLPMKGSKGYLVVQTVIGMVFMFFTINQGFPFDWGERLLMSSLIFVMIIAWGGILQSKTWARILEPLRLVGMAFVYLFLLEKYEMISWTGWGAILIVFWCGLSLFWFSLKTNVYKQAPSL
ncbi:MAG: sterol desaturase [Saprospiraceae bacterium]|nr:MAG: sterol desaturase [Saprospiraceae bacterium]